MNAEQKQAERLEIIKSAVDKVQNRKTIDELDFEHKMNQINNYYEDCGYE